eukprot:scaffold1181_cov180-Pinguiococcus_pyrenoidosus.AAC.1
MRSQAIGSSPILNQSGLYPNSESRLRLPIYDDVSLPENSDRACVSVSPTCTATVCQSDATALGSFAGVDLSQGTSERLASALALKSWRNRNSAFLDEESATLEQQPSPTVR